MATNTAHPAGCWAWHPTCAKTEHERQAERIRELEEEVERLRKENSDWIPKFQGMRPTGNGIELTITEAHEVLLGMTEAMATALGEAENYVEAEVQAAGQPRYIFTVQRHSKPTPHELRRKAEAERDQLRADAIRWATALTRQTEMTSHQHDDTCAAESCEAARWLSERGQP